MTGGRAVVLGLVGRNFAAGMSGGLAFVLDRERMFHGRCNTDMVDIEPVAEPDDQRWLHDTLHDFVVKTGSTLAQSLLDDWPQSLDLFHKVCSLHFTRYSHHTCPPSICFIRYVAFVSLGMGPTFHNVQPSH